MQESLKEPTTYEETSQDSSWMKAMEEEIAALEQNQTWELLQKPKKHEIHILQVGIHDHKHSSIWIDSEI